MFKRSVCLLIIFALCTSCYAETGATGSEIFEEYGLEIEESTEHFIDDERLIFCLYMTVADVCHHIDYVTQNHNPEVSFDPAAQELSAHFYLTYFANCNKAEAQTAVEKYTDLLIAALTSTYPQLKIDLLDINWQIPSIDPDSLYAARYWCESNEGIIERADGKGEIYE